MALVVVAATFVLLFLAFGSIVLPVKAITMNVLSLSAAFGAVVWIFQDGHLSGLLRFTPDGTIDPTMPILMLAYDDLYAIEYFERKERAWWRRNGATAADLVRSARREHD